MNGLKIRLKTESPDRAVERTIIFLEEWAKESKMPWYTYFGNVSPNLAVFSFAVVKYLLGAIYK